MTAESAKVRVAVITGTRAEFGLLMPIMRAIAVQDALELKVIVTGTHLLPDVNTIEEVRASFPISATVQMQEANETGRTADVVALGRGISELGHVLDQLQPDVVLVLGDRIEAFAAAIAGSVGGFLIAHVHGGDRAEGVADEAMRHAISKLAHLHFPATAQSCDRLVTLGEDPQWITVVGSPAVDGLDQIQPMSDEDLGFLGLDPIAPFAVILQHPSGLADEIERSTMDAILQAVVDGDVVPQFVLMAPNRDPGRDAVLQAIEAHGLTDRVIEHLPRAQFVSLLRRSAVLVGNSSAGLIEAAVIGLRVVNVGPRQNGRERADNVVDVDIQAGIQQLDVEDAMRRALSMQIPWEHPYGDGTTGPQIASHLADLSRRRPSIRKRNAY